MDEKTILKYALENAVKYDGKGNPGAVIGKLFANNPELKKQANEISKKIKEVIQKVNSMSLEEQEKELNKFTPSIKKEDKKDRDIFAFLDLKGKINTAFPPAPEKYPHIGHAKACLLNYLLAKKHEGKFILRFDDTDPKVKKPMKNAKKIFLEDLEFLKCKVDEIYFASDRLDIYYEYLRKLINKGKAYICKCENKKWKEKIRKGIACE